MLEYYNLIKSAIIGLPLVNWHEQFLPISVLSTLHAIRVALFYRYLFAPGKTVQQYFHVPKLQGLIVNIILALGGGILSSFLFGRYVPWLASNWVLPLYSFIHFSIMYSPSDIVFKTLYLIGPFINPFLVIADGISRGFAITTTIDIIRTSSPAPLSSSYIAMILGGTVAACGGGIMLDLFKLNSLQWELRTPNFIQKLPLGMKTPFFLSISYLLATYPEFPVSKYLNLLYAHFPLFHKFEIILFKFGKIHVTDAQAAICLAFVMVLFYEEYFVGPMFNFWKVKNVSPLIEKEAEVEVEAELDSNIETKSINSAQEADLDALNASFEVKKSKSDFQVLSNPVKNGKADIPSCPPSPSRHSSSSISPHD